MNDYIGFRKCFWAFTENLWKVSRKYLRSFHSNFTTVNKLPLKLLLDWFQVKINVVRDDHFRAAFHFFERAYDIFSEEKDFYGYLVNFSRKQNDFWQRRTRSVGSEVPLNHFGRESFHNTVSVHKLEANTKTQLVKSSIKTCHNFWNEAAIA